MKLFSLFAVFLCWGCCPIDSVGLREEFTWSKISFATTESLHRPENGGTSPNGIDKFDEVARNINNEYIFGKYLIFF